MERMMRKIKSIEIGHRGDAALVADVLSLFGSLRAESADWERLIKALSSTSLSAVGIAAERITLAATPGCHPQRFVEGPTTAIAEVGRGYPLSAVFITPTSETRVEIWRDVFHIDFGRQPSRRRAEEILEHLGTTASPFVEALRYKALALPAADPTIRITWAERSAKEECQHSFWRHSFWRRRWWTPPPAAAVTGWRYVTPDTGWQDY